MAAAQYPDRILYPLKRAGKSMTRPSSIKVSRSLMVGIMAQRGQAEECLGGERAC